MGTTEPKTLADVVDLALVRRGEQHLVGLQRLAQGRGYDLTSQTLSQIRGGKYNRTPSDRTIRVLAWLAELPFAQVARVAGIPAGTPFRDEIPEGVDILVGHERDALKNLMRSMVATRRQVLCETELPQGITDISDPVGIAMKDMNPPCQPGGSEAADTPAG